MTKTNSTADHFKNYFRFKIYDQKLIAAISAIVGLIAFLQLSVILLIISRSNMDYSQRDQLMMFSRMIYIVALVAAFGVAAYTAFSSFDFCINKHKTDMLGSLPISHRERFFGDLLSGYILSVLPFSLVSALSIPFAAAAGGIYSFSAEYTGYYAYVVLTVFFTLTFLYAIGVLSAAVSGRIIGAIACGVIFVVALETVIHGSVSLFCSNITGFEYTELEENIKGLLPLVSNTWTNTDNLSQINRMFLGTVEQAEVSFKSSPELYAVGNMLNIIAWCAVIAVIICAAFFLSKFRKAERIGGAFGHKYGFYFIIPLIVYVVVIIITTDAYNELAFPVIIATAIVSGVIFLVFEISMRRGWKNFFVGLGVFAASFASIMGTIVLIRITGAFGLRNKLPNVDDIVSVEFNDYKFNDKEDIAAVRQKHLNILEIYKPSIDNDLLSTGRRRYNISGEPVYEGGEYCIRYTLKNGDQVDRVYRVSFYDETGEKCRNDFKNIPIGLKAYNDQLLSKLENYNLDSCDIMYKGYIGGRTLKPEKINELIKLIYEEQQGRVVGSSDKRVGNVTFLNSEEGHDKDAISLAIYESYTKTIAFITDKNNLMPEDETIDYICYDFIVSDHGDGNGYEFTFKIYKSELSDPNVVELLSLLTEEKPENVTRASITCYDFLTTLYLPQENLKRFGELAIEIFKTKLEKANTAA